MNYWKATLAAVSLCAGALPCIAEPYGAEVWTVAQLPANPDLSQSDGSLASLSRQFLSADDYVPQDVDALTGAIDELLTTQSPGSVFLPGAGLGPLVKAVLALEAADGLVERARYRVRYGVASVPMPPAADPVPVSFVQIDRFNLGPAIRKDVVAAYGKGNVAPPAAFGEEPHLSWRLVTRPLMGRAADISAAARMEIAEEGAEAMTCLGAPCLSTASAIEEAAPWSEMEALGANPDAPYQKERNGLPTPAAVIDMLTGDGAFEPRESLEPTETFIETIIETNLGQDTTLDAALREGELMDDSVAAAWRRIAAIPSGPGVPPMVFAAHAYECRRGPDFAEPGEFCP